MSSSRFSAEASYHPSGYGVSQSLKRARKPFITRNLVSGVTILVFTVSVYWYSIAAVKQDDFSDISDLLPPLDERAKFKSIEDEEAERRAKQKAQFAPANSLATSAIPSSSTSSGDVNASSTIDNVISALPALPISPPAGTTKPSRGGEVNVLPFVQGKFGKSLFVNGQVDVDRIGSVWDDGVGGTKRVV